jgi:hypothetical protein
MGRRATRRGGKGGVKALAVATALALGGVALLAAASAHRARSPLPRVDSVRVQPLLEGGVHRFGDLVAGGVDVLVPTAAVDPATVAIRATFSPYRLAGPMRVQRWSDGRTAIVRYRFELDCLDTGCAPGGDGASFSFAPVRVDLRTRAGAVRSVEAAWPLLPVTARPRPPVFSSWRAGVPPLPPASYRIPPRLAAVLAAVLGLLAVGAAAALARALFRARRSRAGAGLLERALETVRRAAHLDDVDERRRALDLLGVALRSRTDGLHEDARRLAWSRGAPAGSAMERLADRAERS